MKNRLKLENIESAYNIIDPVFLNTPQFRCEALEDIAKCRIIVKVETLNPIRSFKGRGASYYVSKLPAGSTLVCASAGNMGQAFAYACRQKGIKTIIYASVNANAYKIARMRALGAEVILEGEDFDAAKIAARKYAQESGSSLVEDSLSIETCEGAGTIAVELLKWKEPIDAVVVALGNGALLTGIARWFKAFSPKTEVIGVVAEGAPAMADSFNSGKIIAYSRVATISDGIAVRNPIPEVLSDMKGTVDKVLAVDDEATLQAMMHVRQNMGILTEPSGAVSLAAVIKNSKIFADKLVAVVICGSNLTDEQIKNLGDK